uniref:uncharacterized protein LOC122607888 n=1 Tax=Erigeron canadensis TaxID=72917 RepID=UPI001CB99748|nr:uncharacterized protein LOC122607888 [Erigeron canadensis]
MQKWRKKGGDKYNNNLNYRRKPPLDMAANQGAVPYWEKRFVSSVGSLSWDHFLEARKFTHIYPEILSWDDTAGERAFRIAKDRFYAKFYGHPCDVEQQNPDLYIDEIDWNAEVDYNLMLDFDAEPVVPDIDNNHEPVLVFGNVLPDPYKDYSPYGWGDSDDKINNSNDINKDQSGTKNWDDYIENGRINWDSWDVGDANKLWWDWDEIDNKAVGKGCNGYVNDNDYHPTYGDVHNESYMSSHKTGSFHGNNSRYNRSWRNNGNWRKTTGRTYGSQHGYWSSFQARGSQRIHVRP